MSSTTRSPTARTRIRGIAKRANAATPAPANAAAAYDRSAGGSPHRSPSAGSDAAPSAPRAFLASHGKAIPYGLAGFAVAALILVVGFWPTLLLALFAAVGAAIGRYRDGDERAQKAARSLIGRASNLLS